MNRALPSLLLLFVSLVAHAQRVDTISLDTVYQRIDNFGASDCWTMQKLSSWSLSSRERVADLLFSQSNGIGLSCWRFNIGGGTNVKITHPGGVRRLLKYPRVNTIGRARRASAGSWARPNSAVCLSSWPS